MSRRRFRSSVACSFAGDKQFHTSLDPRQTLKVPECRKNSMSLPCENRSAAPGPAADRIDKWWKERRVHGSDKLPYMGIAGAQSPLRRRDRTGIADRLEQRGLDRADDDCAIHHYTQFQIEPVAPVAF